MNVYNSDTTSQHTSNGWYIGETMNDIQNATVPLKTYNFSFNIFDSTMTYNYTYP